MTDSPRRAAHGLSRLTLQVAPDNPARHRYEIAAVAAYPLRRLAEVHRLPDRS